MCSGNIQYRIELHAFTLFILMDSPVHTDIINMGQPIMYFKGSKVDFLNHDVLNSKAEVCFNLSKQFRP